MQKKDKKGDKECCITHSEHYIGLSVNQSKHLYNGMCHKQITGVLKAACF